MRISTKVEFGIIAMIDIAIYSENNEAVTVYSIAKRQNISGKYLEQILTVLRQAHLIRGLKGSKGGYIITRPAKDITFKEIIDALDVTVLSDVDFLDQEDSVIASTVNINLWDKLTDYMQKFALNLTLADIIEQCHKSMEQKSEELMYYI
ncbi:MAG: Rrf2 family transcriptional regulator [Acutalibacteraceae bacterium]|nr:Rrf2 family transcriptional regulator [Acutalibacteraceae bacterium]